MPGHASQIAACHAVGEGGAGELPLHRALFPPLNLFGLIPDLEAAGRSWCRKAAWTGRGAARAAQESESSSEAKAAFQRHDSRRATHSGRWWPGSCWMLEQPAPSAGHRGDQQPGLEAIQLSEWLQHEATPPVHSGCWSQTSPRRLVGGGSPDPARSVRPPSFDR